MSSSLASLPVRGSAGGLLRRPPPVLLRTPRRLLRSSPSSASTLPSTTTTTTTTSSSSSPPVCTLSSLDHIVLTVRSIQKTVTFYTEILGMAHQTYSDRRSTHHALLFGGSKIDLREYEHKSEPGLKPKPRTPLPGTADLCFLTEQDVTEVVERLQKRGVKVLDKVARRMGARGPLRSVYVRDPDGNLIE
ncbi:Glyoxalase/Bleomycin resistance protein/Dihydroxybiphenyl dioxygenase [Thermoascus aurantiacus ATCC 26904]